MAQSVTHHSSALLPLILMAVILGVGILAFLYARRRRAIARSPFCCPKCGFDLRGSIQAGAVTCPECGSVYH